MSDKWSGKLKWLVMATNLMGVLNFWVLVVWVANFQELVMWVAGQCMIHVSHAV